MKTKIVNASESKRNNIPEVGEPFSHKNGSDVFIRINDEQGRRALGSMYKDDESLIFCVNLSDGRIYWDNAFPFNRILLRPKNNGAVEFEEYSK